MCFCDCLMVVLTHVWCGVSMTSPLVSFSCTAPHSVLETMLKLESVRLGKLAFPSLLKNDTFHAALLACCMEVRKGCRLCMCADRARLRVIVCVCVLCVPGWVGNATRTRLDVPDPPSLPAPFFLPPHRSCFTRLTLRHFSSHALCIC